MVSRYQPPRSRQQREQVTVGLSAHAAAIKPAEKKSRPESGGETEANGRARARRRLDGQQREHSGGCSRPRNGTFSHQAANDITFEKVVDLSPQEKRQKSDGDSGGSRTSACRKPLTQLNSRLEGLDGDKHVRVCVCACVCDCS